MPSLYIVGTPIGNLEDMSCRAIRILKQVELIASEDTRTTRHLLNHFDIRTKLISYFEHSKSTKLSYLLKILETDDVALVSEAGMPGISDPGYELVVVAQEKGVTVVPVPGPSAAITALAVSGLPSDLFYFLGFLPRKDSERRKKLIEASEQTATLVAYEAPHRLIKALHDIMTVLGNRDIAVCRELTKLHEEIFRGTVDAAIQHFTEPRGEFTLVIAGCSPGAGTLSADEVNQKIKELRRTGKTAREAIAGLADAGGMSRKELYRLWLESGR